MRGAACKGGPYRDRDDPRRPITNTRHISHTRNSRSAALDTDLADPLGGNPPAFATIAAWHQQTVSRSRADNVTRRWVTKHERDRGNANGRSTLLICPPRAAHVLPPAGFLGPLHRGLVV